MEFSNFEEHLDKIEFNHSFLRLYHPILIQYLMEIFSVKESAIECFFVYEFRYSGRDWNMGERWFVPLREETEYRQFLENKNQDAYFKFFY